MSIKENRDFLKADPAFWAGESHSDQSKGVPMPPVQKSVPDDAVRVQLPDWQGCLGDQQLSLDQLIRNRKSHRKYLFSALTLEELSFLLWATQGIREPRHPSRVWRTVPSAGNRHAFETYLSVRLVAGLSPGIYRYQPLEHALILIDSPARLTERTTEAAMGQGFAGQAAVTFFWTAMPYRMEWRYSEAAGRLILLDAGHVCQNLYLAAGAIGCGTCAIAAYNQPVADQLLGVDGVDEFVVYMAPVGHIE